MTRFVSGLASGEPAALDPAGRELLLRIRSRAVEDLRVLAPLTERRFDGAEWLVPDPLDIEAAEIAEATRRLIDLILSDRDLAAPIAAQLGGRR